MTPNSESAPNASVEGSPLATLDVVLPHRRRMTIGTATPETTVFDAACATGLIKPGAAASIILIDGRPVPLKQRLVTSGILNGSRLELDHSVTGKPATLIAAVWVAGVDAGGRVELPTGAHYIGRSSSAVVRCRDRSLELHHALLAVDAGGHATLTQIAGRQPVLVDGSPIDATVPVHIGQRIDIGSSVLVLRKPAVAIGSAAAPPRSDRSGASNDPWRVPLQRSPRPLTPFVAEVIQAPGRRSAQTGIGGGILPALLGLAGAAVMALLFDQAMFFLFGLMGALVAIGTWAAQKIGVLRSRRSSARDHEQAVALFAVALQSQRDRAREAHIASAPTLERAVLAMSSRAAELWSIRPADPDSFRVSIGEGSCVWQPTVSGIDGDTPADVCAMIDAACRFDPVPVCASLAAGTVTALVGGQSAAAVGRSMIIQLAAVSGPADWQLAIIAERCDEWRALGWLGHLDDGSGSARLMASCDIGGFVAGLDPADRRHLVIVIDNTDLLTRRTSALRRLLAGDRSLAVVVLCHSEADIPGVATSALVAGGRGWGRWIADTRANGLAEPLQIAGISADRAFEAAAAIACLIDPEAGDGGTTLPTEIAMVELLADEIGRDASAYARRIAALWSASSGDPAPSSPIGVAADGVIEIDLVADGPHGLLAGTTGAGKSELLRNLVVGLATRSSPDHITFVLVDYKGGSTFDACADLPHTVGLVTDLDDRLATRALRSLEAELRRRERLLRDSGASDLAGYRALDDSGALPRLVVVVDEFASLAVAQPGFIGALLGIAQRGRSLGVHLLLATQRPHGVISDDIRANTNLRIALRVQDRADATDVIGDPSASTLPRSVPGRAIMRLGVDELITFQTARSTATDLDLLVRAVGEATRLNDIAPPYRPWLPPLDDIVGSEMTDLDAIGVVDDPDHQRRRPLTWTCGDGHLLLAGMTGTGTTTALLTIATGLASGVAPPELYVIDAMGDARLSLLHSLPCCVGVVRLSERERLLRLLARLNDEIAMRKSSASASRDRRQIVVVIDGFSALRSELENGATFEQIDQLDRIIAECVSAGVTAVIATTLPGSVPTSVLASIGRRWVFHLTDPADASLLGVRPSDVPGPIAGRLIDNRSGLEAQIIPVDEQRLLDLACSLTIDRPDPGNPVDPGGPRACANASASALGVLPEHLEIAQLPIGGVGAGVTTLPIGVAFTTLQPIVLTIADGEHALIVGPSRSGRTTALGTMTSAWRRVHPHGWVGCVAPRRSSARVGSVFADISSLLQAVPVDAPTLIVIDDAELVDDASAALTNLITGRRDRLTVIAAGRAESLRCAYGHWTGAVRRSRLGLVMASSCELDGDLLATLLPRRLPIPPRAGLAWLVAEGDRQLIQIAQPMNDDPMQVANALDAVGACP